MRVVVATDDGEADDADHATTTRQRSSTTADDDDDFSSSSPTKLAAPVQIEPRASLPSHPAASDMVAVAKIVARPAVPGDAALVEPFVDRCARGRRRHDPNSLVASVSRFGRAPTTHATLPTTHATLPCPPPLPQEHAPVRPIRRRLTHRDRRGGGGRRRPRARPPRGGLPRRLTPSPHPVRREPRQGHDARRGPPPRRPPWPPPAWIAGCAVSDGYQSTVVGPMLRACFLAHPRLDLFLLAASPEVERQPLGKHLAKLAKTTRFALYAAPRATVAPRLRVRRARVEDHDDLVPLYAAVAADPAPPGGALSRVPADDDASGATEEEFALARLIDAALAEPERHCVLVAEVGDTGTFAGVMALSLDGVDADALARDHDLSSYDDLQTDAGETDAFRVTMLAVLPEYRAQSPEFLDAAFECFPDEITACCACRRTSPRFPSRRRRCVARGAARLSRERRVIRLSPRGVFLVSRFASRTTRTRTRSRSSWRGWRTRTRWCWRSTTRWRRGRAARRRRWWRRARGRSSDTPRSRSRLISSRSRRVSISPE